MTHFQTYRYLLGTLLVGLTLTMMPLQAEGTTDIPLIDQMTAIVYDHQRQAVNKNAYEPLIHQVRILKLRFERGHQKSIQRAMEQFLTMLMVDGKYGNGIPKWSAKAIFDLCTEMAPPMNPVSKEKYRDAFTRTM